MEHFDYSWLTSDVEKMKIKFHGKSALSLVFAGAEVLLLQESDVPGCKLMLSKLDPLMHDAKLRKVGVAVTYTVCPRLQETKDCSAPRDCSAT